MKKRESLSSSSTSDVKKKLKQALLALKEPNTAADIDESAKKKTRLSLKDENARNTALVCDENARNTALFVMRMLGTQPLFGLELLTLFCSIVSLGRIIVEGYDQELSPGVVESALRKFYSSCGEITDVYVRTDGLRENTLWHNAFVYFVGEGAVDKALQLNGSDVGGWEASAMAFPFPPRPYDLVLVRVEGYDTSLSETDVKSMLSELFFSCGKVKSIVVCEGSAIVSLFGDKAALKAPHLLGRSLEDAQLLFVVLLNWTNPLSTDAPVPAAAVFTEVIRPRLRLLPEYKSLSWVKDKDKALW